MERRFHILDVQSMMSPIMGSSSSLLKNSRALRSFPTCANWNANAPLPYRGFRDNSSEAFLIILAKSAELSPVGWPSVMVMTKIGLRRFPLRAFWRTNGPRILFCSSRPMGVRPEKRVRAIISVTCCSLRMLLPWSGEFMKRT